MKEETEHFKNMSAEAKEEVARDHSIGPGKMALFVQNYANDLVQEVLCTEREERERVERAIHQQQEQELESKMQRQQQLEQQSAKELLSRQMDTSKPRYACRKCRTIVFGEDDMEDPRHVPQQHKFSNRKQHHGGMGSADACQSYFLTDQGLAWMGDMSAVEGRLGCPKCKTKLGTWHWAGAQCSCGTWVSPAVQIPKSKLDILPPQNTNGEGNDLPPGTIVSQFVAPPPQVQ